MCQEQWFDTICHTSNFRPRRTMSTVSCCQTEVMGLFALARDRPEVRELVALG